MGAWGDHGVALAISFGNRRRLKAALANTKSQSTFGKPRSFTLYIQAIVFSQPNAGRRSSPRMPPMVVRDRFAVDPLVVRVLLLTWGRSLIPAIGRHQTANHSYMAERIRLLELGRNARHLFEKQEAREKRRLLDFLVSNCSWKDGQLTAEFRQPFNLLADTTMAAATATAEGGAESVKSEIWLLRLDSTHQRSAFHTAGRHYWAHRNQVTPRADFAHQGFEPGRQRAAYTHDLQPIPNT